MVVSDLDGAPSSVISCPEGSPAFKAGIRQGDQLLSANGRFIDTAIRYALAELAWTAGQTLELKLLRGGEMMTFELALPPSYPGTLGLQFGDTDAGVEISNR